MNNFQNNQKFREFVSDTIFQKWSKVVKVMVFLKLCTKICKCTERCARVDFPPTGSKWRSCGSTPLKTIVFEAIVILHRTSWLRMRAFLVRPSIFLILRPQFKICVARVRPWGKFLIQNFVIRYFY